MTTLDKMVDHIAKKYPQEYATWSSEYNLKCSGLSNTHEQYMQGFIDYIKERAGAYFTQTGTFKLPTKAEMNDETKQMRRLE